MKWRACSAYGSDDARLNDDVDTAARVGDSRPLPSSLCLTMRGLKMPASEKLRYVIDSSTSTRNDDPSRTCSLATTIEVR